MSDKIQRREDVDPHEGIEKYGKVEFADPVNNKYPIDTEGHVRAAWRYINIERNTDDEYSDAEVEVIKQRIRNAAEQHGIEIDEGNS